MHTALLLSLLACTAKDLPPPPDGGGPDAETDGTDDTASSPSGDDTATTDTTAPDDTATIDTASSDTAATDTGAGWLTLTGCEAPALPDDPIERVYQYSTGEESDHPEIFMESTEMVVQWDRGRLFSVGGGGFYSFELIDDYPEVRSRQNGTRNRFDAIADVSDGDIIAVAHRETATVHLYDTERLDAMVLDAEFQVDAFADMTARGDGLLYTVSFDGVLTTWDASDPTDPTVLHNTEGLVTPWDMVIDGDHLYISDASLGIVPVDLSDPRAPVIGAATAADAAIQRMDIDGDTLYAAAGSSGILIYSLADPSAPSLLAQLPYSSVVDVAAEDGVLWAVNHEDAIAIDVSDPSSPVMIGAQRTDEWALNVMSHGTSALVGDWGNFDYYAVDADVRSPEAHYDRSELFFYGDDAVETTEVVLSNRGADTLRISGGSVDDPRFTVEADRLELAPGESARVRVSFADDGEPMEATLCVATNDPDQPVEEFPLAEVGEGLGGLALATGMDAVDFTLGGLDGETYRLSDYLGKPVVLVFFGVW